MLFNVPFVLGALVAAQIIPDSGKSYLLIAVAAAGYLLAAAVYGAVSRQDLLAGPSPAGPAAAGSSRPGAGGELPADPASDAWPADRGGVAGPAPGPPRASGG
jgi:hypothetical protein